ncbi:kinase-like domain-containing protein [Mycena vitilis]|nr:kinase-like domain-containing protein [Mycena vitilis]
MSLQIPSPSRPVSAAVSPTAQQSRRQPPQHRASHQVVSSSTAEETQPAFTDVYAHPAAMAFAAAHPRRTIPKFGPYLLLQTLGEGEFGKVKLGLHCQWGEEVAVKLIRRGNVDTAVRMSKVEREIEVLRTLKHPNIVRLYDVIETDKYIGIIIEYASGGELFDHILAHRYLRERDASKLFSQLISGVWYIHQKKIVHRDLKLENLLLDRHRNVIITDFGFANRFEHRADDLMQTSCGSPCYAAPELVISEGLYVGSAVDIWSCGVILYAMLAGYLPFDDDPANPDGDNINLLYKVRRRPYANISHEVGAHARAVHRQHAAQLPGVRLRGGARFAGHDARARSEEAGGVGGGIKDDGRRAMRNAWCGGLHTHSKSSSSARATNTKNALVFRWPMPFWASAQREKHLNLLGRWEARLLRARRVVPSHSAFSHLPLMSFPPKKKPNTNGISPR